LAPAFASATAKAWPKPVLPPVTMAHCPRSEKKSSENVSSDSVMIPSPGLNNGQKKGEKQAPSQ
jgi:hypothetical protein